MFDFLGAIGSAIMTPLYYFVSGIMLAWHWLFEQIGLDPNSGWGWALSIVGLTVGTALAFTGTTFPVIDAPVFVRIWSALLPLTAYLDLQMQQLLMGVPMRHAWRPVLAMLAVALVAGGVGAWRLRAAVRIA